MHAGMDTNSFGDGNDYIMISKFDSNGNHIRSKTWGKNETEAGQGLTLDFTGDVYLTGHTFVAGSDMNCF